MEMRRPLSEKSLGSRNPVPVRPTSQKAISAMKSSLQLQKQNQNFYSKYFSSKEQKENLEIRSNEVRIPDRPSSQPKLATKNPKEYLEYKKLQDKLQYLENKIITIKQHIDSSQKQPKSGLAAKFFQQSKPQTAVNPTRQSMIQQTDPTPTQQVKTKSNTITDAGTSNTVVKKPSLSTFVTQVKFQSNENTNKNLVNKPDSAKSTQSKQQFKRKVSSQDMQMYQSMNPVNFLFYMSSIIKGYMQSDITRPIEQIREHLIQTMQACQYARTNKPTSQSIIDEKKVMLPDTNKRTIVFDLDETLIHCNESIKVPGDVILPIKFPSGEVIEASINIRPYAQQILQTLSRYFEVIVFTASHSCYANVVIDYLDPSRQWVSHRFFRESCVQSDEGAYLKDLRVIGNRQLSDLVLIDNAAYSFALQLQNGIPIVNFYDNKQDQVLQIQLGITLPLELHNGNEEYQRFTILQFIQSQIGQISPLPRSYRIDTKFIQRVHSLIHTLQQINIQLYNFYAMQTMQVPKPGTIYQCLSPTNQFSQFKEQVRSSNHIDDNRIKQFQKLLQSYTQTKSPNSKSKSIMRKSLNEPMHSSYQKVSLQDQIVRLVSSVTPSKEDKSSMHIRHTKTKASIDDLQIIYKRVRERFQKHEEEKKQWQEEKLIMQQKIQQLEIQLANMNNLEQSFG